MAEFVKAVRTAELVPGEGTVLELNGVNIAIFNVDGAFYAMNDTCTHASGPLSEGELGCDTDDRESCAGRPRRKRMRP